MIFYDTETTGLTLPKCSNLEFQPRIIEIAMIQTDDEFNIIRQFESFVNPEIPIPAIITKITGIEEGDVKDAPTFSEIFPDVKEFFESDDVVIAHNLRFDLNMLKNDCLRIGKEIKLPSQKICTVSSSMHITGKMIKLQTLYEMLLGKPAEQKHRALDDVRLLLEMYKELVK